MAVGYTDEPQENSAELLTLSDGGRMLGTERIVERTPPPDGAVRIITEESGEDDRVPALFRRAYTLGPAACSIRKLVRLESTSEFFERNAYAWTR